MMSDGDDIEEDNDDEEDEDRDDLRDSDNDVGSPELQPKIEARSPSLHTVSHHLLDLTIQGY